MIFLTKNKLVVISVVLACVLTSIFCISALKNTPVGSAELSKIRIVLDAGHGGVDGGVSGTISKVKESEINLKVVKKLEKLFYSAGFDVVLTRSSDGGLYGVATKNRKRKDMQKRKEIIEKSNPNLVISVHMNKFSSSARRGAQVFYKNGDPNGETLANLIQDSFNKMESSKREFSPLVGDYYVLNCSDIPSVICECGFLSNPEEESLLITDEYQEKIAEAIFDGVTQYLSKETGN